MKPNRTSSQGEAARSRGRCGEQLAASLLRASGYRIAARNLRTRDGEIDLLVRRGRLWVAVEVKTRASHPAPEHTCPPARIERLQRALQRLAPGLRPRPRRLRVDVVAVRLSPHAMAEIRHFLGQEYG